ncbi:MAG: Glutathione-binding protein GsiB precursor [Firmicutes bacterium ADurb.Bin248]|nr:MAG: Glutathione-binding protein GsiB precursor [Firmicutes bacterium ADurb.Bin248]HOG00548.1 ABC transporter substrate-binding protein [Clostridia bacterium]
MKRLVSLLLVSVMLMGAIVGCTAKTPADDTQQSPPPATGNVPAESAGPAEPAKKDTLVVGISVEPQTLNVAEVGLLYTDTVNRLLYDTLVRLDQDMNVVPQLAESFEPLSDTEWKFVLREGVKFSDGSVVTSEDAKASIELVAASAAIGAYAGWLKEIKIIDERTFIVVTKQPSERMLADLCTYSFIVPKKLIDSGYNFSEGPVGTGPYRLVEWKRGDRLIFVANDEYFLEEDRAAIKNLIWRIMPEGIARTIALENGEVDFLFDVQASDLKQLEANENIEVYSTPYASPFYIAFNLNKPGMDNLNVRKAIAAAINRDNATLLATDGYSPTFYSCAIPGMLGSTNENAEPYNVEKAKEYIAASGLSGDQLKFTVICKEEPFKIALESIQADLLEIGVALDVQMMDTATYTARGAEGSFDMITGKYNAFDLLAYAEGAFKTGAAFNFNFISDPYIDGLIEKGTGTIDNEARGAIIEELISYCNGLALRTGIYQLTTIRAFNKDLGGFTTNLNSYDRFNKLYWK